MCVSVSSDRVHFFFFYDNRHARRSFEPVKVQDVSPPHKLYDDRPYSDSKTGACFKIVCMTSARD